MMATVLVVGNDDAELFAIVVFRPDTTDNCAVVIGPPILFFWSGSMILTHPRLVLAGT